MAMIAAALPALNSPPMATAAELRADPASRKLSGPGGAFKEILQDHRDQSRRELSDDSDSMNSLNLDSQSVDQIDEIKPVETDGPGNDGVADKSTGEPDLQPEPPSDDASGPQQHESKSASNERVESQPLQRNESVAHLPSGNAQHHAIESRLAIGSSTQPDQRPVQGRQPAQFAHPIAESCGLSVPGGLPSASVNATTATTTQPILETLPPNGESAPVAKSETDQPASTGRAPGQAAPTSVPLHPLEKVPDRGAKSSPDPLVLNQRPVIDTQSLPIADAVKVNSPAESGPTENQTVAVERDEKAHRPSSKSAPAIRGSGGAGGEPTPALARAAQVDLGIRLENATGQAPVDAPMRTAAAAQPQHPAAQLSPSTFQTATNQHSQSTAFSGHVADSAPEIPFANQVVRGLTAMLNQRGGVMNMRLDPPELGALRVQMTIARGVVSAEFQSSNQQAQGLLEKSMATLRTALESQGLTVDRLSVHTAHAAVGNSGAQFQRDDANTSGQPSLSRQSHDAGGQESRGRGEHQHEAPARQHRAATFNELFHEFESQTS